MKIVIFLFTSFTLLFSNIDRLIGDFESGYMSAEKKMSKSESFNKKMMAQKKAHAKSMSKMNKMSAIDMTIKNQQSINNKENMLKVINREIEAYLDGLMPTILIVCLFVLLIFIMYAMVSAMNASSLKQKVSDLEDMLSEQPNNRDENSNEEYRALSNNVKKINLRLDSAEAVIHKLLYAEMNEEESPRRATHNKKTQTKKTPKKKQTNTDDLIIDDDFAMDEHDDEELLNLDSDKRGNKKNSAPLSNLSSLDMDIGATNTKNKNKNIKDMEEFSLDDFNE